MLDFISIQSDIYTTKLERRKHRMEMDQPPTCPDIDLVEEAFGCPNCHNRNMDELVWLDDETVKCPRCNTEYQP